MKNPLLVPELRDMIASNRLDDLREFCNSTSPEVAAEFLGALTTRELKDALALLEAPARETVFAHLDDEARLALVDDLDKQVASDLMAAMPDNLRIAFLEHLSDEQQAKMKTIFEQAPPEEAQPLLETLEEAREKPEPEEMTPEEIAAEVAQHLEFFRVAGDHVESIPHIERGCWVNIVDPTKENLPLIASHFKIPLDFLTSSLDIDETARIEVDQGATLFIIKVPYFDEKNVDVLYFTIPIGVILTNGLTITVCSKRDSVLRAFVNNQVRHPAVGHRFILQIVFRATLLFLQHLKQLNNTASVIQKKLEQESRNQQLIKLFNIEKSLVYFTTSLKSNLLMLERLQRLRGFELNLENEDLLEDTLTECKQAIEMANIYSDILSGMMDAFASVISNNLNLVMRLLTSITIVITIPVLVTGFFGMNVSLPLDKEPYAYLVVLGLCVVLCLSAVTYFRRKRWLE